MELIRGPSSVAPFINIVSEYKEDTQRAESALEKINSKPTGKALLNEIKSLSKNGRNVEIQVSDNFDCHSIAFLTESQLKKYNISDPHGLESNLKACEISTKKGFMHKGEGVSVVIDFRPTDAIRFREDGTQVSYRNEKEGFVMLAHELIHAMRMMKGTHISDFKVAKEGSGHSSEIEERRVIGFGEFSKKQFTENQIRKEHNLRERHSHDAVHDYEQDMWEADMMRPRTNRYP